MPKFENIKFIRFNKQITLFECKSAKERVWQNINGDFVELAGGTGVVIKNSAISPSYFVSLTVARVVLLANNIEEKWEKRINLSLVSPPVTTLRTLFVMIKHYKTRQLLSICAVMYIWAPHNWDFIRIYIFQMTRDKLLESGI